MYSVRVSCRIKPGEIGALLPRMLRQARESAAMEFNCHQFDHCTSPDSPYEAFLYELNADREAFDFHLGSSHFLEIEGDVGGWVERKEVRCFAEVRLGGVAPQA